MKRNVNAKRRDRYVPHPRYGSQPRFTGLDVKKSKKGVFVRCWTAEELESWIRKNSFDWINPAQIGCLIPGTAIVADPARQVGSCMASTHYYDIEKTCRDCSRLFIFFAEEQRYWYEELQFPVDADCVRCAPCRKRSQSIDRLKERYDELSAAESLTLADELEMTLARLDLVEAGIFHPRQIEQVRAFLNRHPDHELAITIKTRLAEVADNGGAPN
jgi:hypothetical protein